MKKQQREAITTKQGEGKITRHGHMKIHCKKKRRIINPRKGLMVAT